MTTLRCTVALSSTLLLTGCVSNQVAPQLNPNPKYFITVKGHIDPKLQQDLTMNWAVEYYTNNKQCEYFPTFDNRLEGAPVGRIKTVKYPVKPNKQGNYSIKIPLNNYVPGFCQWKVGEIYYQYSYKDYKMTNATGENGVGISTEQGKRLSLSMNQTRLCGAMFARCKLISSNTLLALGYQISNQYPTTAIVNFNYQGDKP